MDLDPIETDQSADTGGKTLLDSIETIGINAANQVVTVASDAINQGRMPYDPADPNFGAVRPPQTGKGKSISVVGLLILFLLLKGLFK